MSKITKMDKARMQEHLRELSKLAMKANIKHHTVIDKNISQSNELLKMLKEERQKNKRLQYEIAVKQTDIDDLEQRNIDQLWELSKLEQKLNENAAGDAQYEKRLKQVLNKGRVDN